MEIIDLFIEQSTLILTGIIISFISSIIYRITPTGFVSAGKFRTKEGAIAIYLFSAMTLGFFTPIIYVFSEYVLKSIPIISIVGLLIFLANFILNQSVPTWKHTSKKTLLIYAISVLLIILGIFSNIFLL